MTRQSIFRRFVIPLILVVGVWAVSSAVYNNAWRLDHGILRTLAVGIFGPLLFLSIWFFAFVGPPIAYFRGASFIERFIIAFVNPVCWVVRVEAQVACQYDFVELIYFFFLPWTFGVICVTLLEFSLADIGCRVVDRWKRPNSPSILPVGVLVLLVLGVAGMYFGLIKGQEWVYFVVHNYAAGFPR